MNDRHILGSSIAPRTGRRAGWLSAGIIRAGSKITDYPHRTQSFAYDCGATAVLTVLQYYGYNLDKLNEQSVFDAIGTDVNGTENQGIESGLQKLGMPFQKVSTLADIDINVDNGYPVVVCACTYPRDWHYMVVIARDGMDYIVSDPWSVNLSRVSIDIFDKVWHEEDGTRWGVAVIGESKFHGGITPMDVKLAREILTIAKEIAD